MARAALDEDAEQSATARAGALLEADTQHEIKITRETIGAFLKARANR